MNHFLKAVYESCIIATALQGCLRMTLHIAILSSQCHPRREYVHILVDASRFLCEQKGVLEIFANETVAPMAQAYISCLRIL